jgi:hypothetical protein
MVRSNHNKTEKRLKKIILWWRHHLRLDVAIWKEKSPYHHADETADVVVVTLIFNRAVMKKTITSCSLTIVGEEEKINLNTKKLGMERP